MYVAAVSFFFFFFLSFVFEIIFDIAGLVGPALGGDGFGLVNLSFSGEKEFLWWGREGIEAVACNL